MSESIAAAAMYSNNTHPPLQYDGTLKPKNRVCHYTSEIEGPNKTDEKCIIECTTIIRFTATPVDYP